MTHPQPHKSYLPLIKNESENCVQEIKTSFVQVNGKIGDKCTIKYGTYAILFTGHMPIAK